MVIRKSGEQEAGYQENRIPEEIGGLKPTLHTSFTKFHKLTALASQVVFAVTALCYADSG